MANGGFDYSVGGTVRDYESGRALSGLKVRAYDRDFFRSQLLGGGTTDENGRYEITFRREDFTGPLIKLERHPDLFVRVFDAGDQLLYASDRSVVVDAGRHTSIDIQLPHGVRNGSHETAQLFGVTVNPAALAKLSASDILAAYKLMHNPALRLERADRIRAAIPGLFVRKAAPPECGNGVREFFRYLMKERNAVEAFDFDPDPFAGAGVKQFFTANIVVKYTTDGTLPGGAANPNVLPAASAVLPAADSSYAMPSGTVIGTVRAALADLNPANTEVAPIYIQKVGLLAEHSLSRFIAAPFSYLDPRGGLSRLEFRILGLTAGVAGYAVPSDFHMELNLSNSDTQNLGTVPHELFHLVQFRYNAGGGPANGIRGSVMEGGARLLEESINETPNRYVESAVDGDLSGSAVPRKGILNFPEETLLDISGSQSLVRYAAGLLWKYIAEQHSTATGPASEPAIGVDSYRTLIERMTTGMDDFSIAAVRNGRSALPWYGTFDRFSYYDSAATELNSHETTWGNFLVANYFHRLWTPSSGGFDLRFDYKEDEDPAGNVAQLNTYGSAIQTGNAVTLAQGGAVTKNVSGHKPFAAVYYEITPSAASAPRMLRVSVVASGGMTDPLVQIVRIGAGNSLVDIHRSDKTGYAKTLSMSGLSKVLVIVASREHGGDFTLNLDEVASASDVMVTRWNSRVGTEYEVDPRGWSWTWISPDIMVDSNGDGLDDTSVLFGQNNKLKLRLRNRGNANASSITVDFWYQKATPHLSSAAWIPVQNLASVTQRIVGATLAAGAEQWLEVDWCPADDGTHHSHWCVKVQVSVAGDPNTDNKIAFRNFNNVTVGSPDSRFSALIRYHGWSASDALLLVPRARRYRLELLDPKDLPRPTAKGEECACSQRQILGVPGDLSYVRLALAESELKPWDGRDTGSPQRSGAYYPVDDEALPPGVRGDEIVTLAHVRAGQIVGGISYRLRTS